MDEYTINIRTLFVNRVDYQQYSNALLLKEARLFPLSKKVSRKKVKGYKYSEENDFNNFADY